MIPPTSIDGTDITGATIDGADVQEITVDGQTVFTAVQPPAFAIHQWKMDEGSGTTVADSIGSLDATLENGAGWATDSQAVGGTVTDYDGSNDYAEVTGSSSFYEPSFAIGVTAEFDDNNRSPIINKGLTSAAPDNSPAAFDLTRVDDQRVFWRIIQDSTDTRIDTEFLGTTPTNQKVRFFVISDTVRTALFIDGDKKDESGPITIDNINSPIEFGGDTTGINQYYTNGKLDNIIFYANSTISDTVATEDYNRQPWS